MCLPFIITYSLRHLCLQPLRLNVGCWRIFNTYGKWIYWGNLFLPRQFRCFGFYSKYFRVLIGSQLFALGCTSFGQLGSSSSSSDYFAQYKIQSDTENSQLRAFLVFNYVGGFYGCGSGQDVRGNSCFFYG